MAQRIVMMLSIVLLGALPGWTDVLRIDTQGNPGVRAEMRGGIFIVVGEPGSPYRFAVVSGLTPDGLGEANVLLYDHQTRTWQKAPGDIPVEGPGVPGVGGHLLIPSVAAQGSWRMSGGWDPDTSMPVPMITKVELALIDRDGEILSTRTIDIPEPAPVPRWDHGGTSVQSGISAVGDYISGGYGGNEKQLGFLKDAWLYDPVANAYTRKADLPGAMSGHAVVAQGAEVFSIGWGSDYGSDTLVVVRCDLAADTCEEVQTTGDAPSPRYGHRAVMVDSDLVVVMGGTAWSNAETLSDIYLLSLTDMSWTRLGFGFPTGLTSFAAALLPEPAKAGTAEILVFGGAEDWFTTTYSDKTYLVTIDLPESAADLAVPAVARVPGAGAFFTSLMHLFNKGAVDLELELTFTPRQGSGGEVTTVSHTVPAGVLETIEDPLATLFGFTGSAGRVGSVLMTATSGSPADLLVQTVVFARLDSGQEYGQLFPATRASDAISAGETVYLNTTEDPVTNRVNVGLMAVADGTRFEVTPVDPLGNDLAAAKSYELDEGGNTQINNIHNAYGLGPTANIVIEVAVISGSGLAYASVLDGNLAYAGTSDPTTILPVAAGAEQVTLLEIGSIQGINEFSGSASITNYSSFAAEVGCLFRQRSPSTATASASLSIPAGDTVGYTDLAGDLFAVYGDVGTVVLSATNGAVIGATAREFAIFRDPQGAVTGTAGQLIAGLTSSDRLAPGVTYHFIGLRQAGSGSAVERSNIAIYNPGSGDAEVTVRLVDGVSGAVEGVRSWTVGSESLIQVNSVIQLINAQHDDGEKRIEVEVNRQVYMNAFRVNVWGDPVTLNPFAG